MSMLLFSLQIMNEIGLGRWGNPFDGPLVCDEDEQGAKATNRSPARRQPPNVVSSPSTPPTPRHVAPSALSSAASTPAAGSPTLFDSPSICDSSPRDIEQVYATGDDAQSDSAQHDEDEGALETITTDSTTKTVDESCRKEHSDNGGDDDEPPSGSITIMMAGNPHWLSRADSTEISPVQFQSFTESSLPSPASPMPSSSVPSPSRSQGVPEAVALVADSANDDSQSGIKDDSRGNSVADSSTSKSALSPEIKASQSSSSSRANRVRPIVLLDSSGRAVKEFESQTAAASFLKCDKSNVSKCVNGKIADINGHRLRHQVVGETIFGDISSNDVSDSASLSATNSAHEISRGIDDDSFLTTESARDNSVAVKTDSTTETVDENCRKEHSDKGGDDDEASPNNITMVAGTPHRLSQADLTEILPVQFQSFTESSSSSSASPMPSSMLSRSRSQGVSAAVALVADGANDDGQGDIKADSRGNNVAKPPTSRAAPPPQIKTLQSSSSAQPNRGRPIVLLDTSGRVVREFASQMVAASTLKCDKSNVSKCVNGKTENVNGHRLRYKVVGETVFDDIAANDVGKSASLSATKTARENSRGIDDDSLSATTSVREISQGPDDGGLKKCGECQSTYDGGYGSGLFCSYNCSRTSAKKKRELAKATTTSSVASSEVALTSSSSSALEHFSARVGGLPASAASENAHKKDQSGDMMCEACEKPHDGSYGSGRFCSHSCSRTSASTKMKRGFAKATATLSVALSEAEVVLASPSSSLEKEQSEVPTSKSLSARVVDLSASAASESTHENDQGEDTMCEACEKPHDGSYGSGRFCGEHCSRHSNKVKKKLAKARKMSSLVPTEAVLASSSSSLEKEQSEVPTTESFPARVVDLSASTASKSAHKEDQSDDMKCEACEKLHDGSYGSGRFCSHSCSRTSASTKMKRGLAKVTATSSVASPEVQGETLFTEKRQARDLDVPSAKPVAKKPSTEEVTKRGSVKNIVSSAPLLADSKAGDQTQVTSLRKTTKSAVSVSDGGNKRGVDGDSAKENNIKDNKKRAKAVDIPAKAVVLPLVTPDKSHPHSTMPPTSSSISSRVPSSSSSSLSLASVVTSHKQLNKRKSTPKKSDVGTEDNAISSMGACPSPSEVSEVEVLSACSAIVDELAVMPPAPKMPLELQVSVRKAIQLEGKLESLHRVSMMRVFGHLNQELLQDSALLNTSSVDSSTSSLCSSSSSSSSSSLPSSMALLKESVCSALLDHLIAQKEEAKRRRLLSAFNSNPTADSLPGATESFTPLGLERSRSSVVSSVADAWATTSEIENTESSLGGACSEGQQVVSKSVLVSSFKAKRMGEEARRRERLSLIKRLPTCVAAAADGVCAASGEGNGKVNVVHGQSHKARPKGATIKMLRRLARQGGGRVPEWELPPGTHHRGGDSRTGHGFQSGYAARVPEPPKKEKKVYVKSAWNNFCDSFRKIVVAQNPTMSFGEIGRELGRRWSLLNAEDRSAFKDPAKGLEWAAKYESKAGLSTALVVEPQQRSSAQAAKKRGFSELTSTSRDNDDEDDDKDDTSAVDKELAKESEESSDNVEDESEQESSDDDDFETINGKKTSQGGERGSKKKAARISKDNGSKSATGDSKVDMNDNALRRRLTKEGWQCGVDISLNGKRDYGPQKGLELKQPHRWVGLRVRRFYPTGRNDKLKKQDGKLVAWMPANDEEEDEPALWRMVHADGDEEDLEEAEVRQAISAFDENMDQPPEDIEEQTEDVKSVASEEEQEEDNEGSDSESIDGDEGDDEDEGNDEDESDDDDLPPEWHALPETIKDRVMEVVWVKFSGKDPWWPGLIYHPTGVQGELLERTLKTIATKYLVYFYGSGDWSHVDFANVRPLSASGEASNPPQDTPAIVAKLKKLTPKQAAFRKRGIAIAFKEVALAKPYDRAAWLVNPKKKEPKV